MREDLANILDFTKQTAWQAGKLIADARDSDDLSYTYKRGIELVSSADEMSDAFIRSAIQQQFPSHPVLSEEGDDSLDKIESRGPIWIVDPLDGTVNYAHRHAHVSISIAYAEDGLVQVGVVYCPFREETFSAMKGEGSWRNDVKLQVSDQTEIKRALISTGFPHDRSNIDPFIRKVRALVLHCQDIRRLGSPALEICWVADGRLDGVYETLFPWDIAAACLVAEEAGATKGHLGQVPSNIPVDLYGQDIVVATPHIFRPLVRILRGEA